MEVPLYETRRHASSYPPQLHLQQNQQHQAIDDSKGTLLSLLSVRGVSQLKEKWTEYNEPKRLRKLVSLFVSPTAKYVAVASGNRITILSKEDDYQQSYAIFTGSDFGTFSVGAWYEDDTKSRPLSEKNWGLFDANDVPIYILYLTASGAVLANDTSNQTLCVAKNVADQKMIRSALDWACGPGKVECSSLLQGQPCYEPDNVIAHANYAFDSYYNNIGKTPDACDFKGVATITT